MKEGGEGDGREGEAAEGAEPDLENILSCNDSLEDGNGVVFTALHRITLLTSLCTLEDILFYFF